MTFYGFGIKLGGVVDTLHRMLAQKFLLLLLTVDTTEEALHLYFAGKLHYAVNHGLGTRRAAREIHVDRNNLVYAFHYVVAVAERAAAHSACTCGNDIFWFGHLVVQAAQHGCMRCTIVPATIMKSA